MYAKSIASFTTGTLAVLGLLLFAGPSHAQQGWPINNPTGSSSFPWNSPGFSGYNQPEYATAPIVLSGAIAQPQKYEVYINAVPMQNTEDPNSVTLVAHVPENAHVWVDDKPTTSTGTLRTFQSPSLAPGNFWYTVRVTWIEDGKVVSQTNRFPVKPGDVQCVYLVESGSQLKGEKNAVQANLAKLTLTDRKLAAAQKFCAVQNGVLLGAMGVPVKIEVNGQPVFLCCDSCRSRAESNPDGTLAKVKELKSKTQGPAPK